MTVEGKVNKGFWIDPELYDKFRDHVIAKYGTIQALSVELENFISVGLEMSPKVHTHTKLSQEQNKQWIKVKPIVNTLREEGYEKQIPGNHLMEIIKAVAGVDKRTVNSRIQLLKDLKVITGEIKTLGSKTVIYELNVNPFEHKVSTLPEVKYENETLDSIINTESEEERSL